MCGATTFSVPKPLLYFLSIIVLWTLQSWLNWPIVIEHYSIQAPFSLLLAFLLIPSRGKWARGWCWLFYGPRILAENYKYGVPFTVQTPELPYLVVSSKEHIREIGNLAENRLSLVAVAEEIFQPKHTMNGIDMGALEMHRRLLRKTSSRLPWCTPVMKSLVERAFAAAMNDSGKTDGSWTKLRSFSMTTRIISLANVYMFFGQELSEDAVFVADALQYAHDVVFSAEAIRLTPAVFASFTTILVTRNHRASKAVRAKLRNVVRQRIALAEANMSSHSDYLQGVVDCVSPETSDRATCISNHLLALWFASIHQPAMTLLYAMHDLCSHPEYIELLREEIEASQAAIRMGKLSELHLLDSFLKESTRVNTAETISLRRKVLKTSVLADGTEVPADHWICVPQREVMNDPSLYPNAEHFDGSRFLKQRDTRARSEDEPGVRLTDVHPFYPFWGLGKETCPGRFYAAHMLKLAMIHILENFDIKTSGEPEVQIFLWRSTRLPRFDNYLSFRGRA